MKIRLLAGAVALAATLAGIGAARAEFAEQWDGGFTTRHVVEVAVPADRAYAALGEIGRWWDDEHTYSGAGANMTMPLKAGACFCEALPGGGVAHGTVVVAWPAQGMVRVHAALGPLQELGVSGALTFKIEAKGGKAQVVQTYAVGGGRPGFAKTYAAIVDQVVGQQLARFERYVETGKPE